MQKGRQPNVRVSGPPGPPGLLLPLQSPWSFPAMSSIQDSLSVCSPTRSLGPPTMEGNCKVLQPSTALQCVPVTPTSSLSINSSARTPDNAIFPQGVPKLNSIYTEQHTRNGTSTFCPSVPPASPSYNNHSQHWATGRSCSRFSFKCMRRHLCFRFSGMKPE